MAVRLGLLFLLLWERLGFEPPLVALSRAARFWQALEHASHPVETALQLARASETLGSAGRWVLTSINSWAT